VLPDTKKYLKVSVNPPMITEQDMIPSRGAAMEQSSVLLQSDTNELEIVEFRIDEPMVDGRVNTAYFGVNVAKVREIIRIPQLWKVFNAHPAVAGMIKLRDKVITVLDLTVMLNKSNDLPLDRIVVLEFNRLTIGILVHAVSRIYRISWAQVEAPGQAVESSQVTGLVKMDDRIILLLDFEKIVGEICPDYALRSFNELPPTGETSLRSRADKKILVADDSPFIRSTITSTLRSAGFQVEEAENGEIAYTMIMNKLQCAGDNVLNEINLLITDVEMPKMDGLHLTSLLRKESGLAKLPIIIFSSMASDDNRRKWGELGAAAIITKPDIPRLVELIDELTENQ
jgi:two-component system, chemotaxis family, chemotaxis protein CheV